MRRALTRLSNEQFDLLIIGGGATGAFLARDAALRGLTVALVEARDFAAATSAHNSKLAHGGLRYLRNLELGLVRESLRERGALLRIAPHLVRPLPFLLPVHEGGARWMLSAGLWLYDLLEIGGRPLPRHHWVTRATALAEAPVLSRPDLRGAFRYHDAQMYAPERIALECLIEADREGAALANHLAAETLLTRNGKVEGASVRDALDGAAFDIRARCTVIAAGPWSDLFLERASGRKPAHPLLRSKGIHLLLPSVGGPALTVEAGAGHFFVLPWRGHTLLGTTDTAYVGDPGAVGVSEADIAGLLATANHYLPAARLDRAQVRFFYAGLRPLVDEGGGQTYKASRRAAVVDHAAEGMDGLLSALGGKWTTSRALAQSVTDLVARKLDRALRPCVTASRPLPGGSFDDFDSLARGFEKTYPGIPAMRHLAHLFGARLPMLLKDAKVADLAALGPGGDTQAQVDFAVRHEMALTLEDAVMRRTSLGQFGPFDALPAVARRMAALLGWDDARMARETEQVTRLFRTAA